MEYKLQLLKIDEDGDEYILTERTLSADDAITYLLEIREAIDEPVEHIEEEQAAPSTPMSQPTGRAPRACGICGKQGHNKKTCPSTSRIEAEPEPDNSDDDESPFDYKNDILDMLRDGTSERDIYEHFRDSITNAQFREAFEWAKDRI